jgi:hypothetical protein
MRSQCPHAAVSRPPDRETICTAQTSASGVVLEGSHKLEAFFYEMPVHGIKPQSVCAQTKFDDKFSEDSDAI